MMRRAFLAAAAVVGISVPAIAAPWNATPGVITKVGGTPYVGPGDIATFQMGWSCTRAYSAAVAAANSPACDLVRISDGATCTVKLKSDGTADYTTGTVCNGNTQTVTAWAGGSVGVGVGSVTGTVLTITSLTSGTFAVGDLVYGDNTSTPGLTTDTYITSLGTGTGGIGTYNVNNSQTRVSQNISAFPGIVVSKAYDQTGGNACTGSCDITQTTGGRRPLLKLTGCGAGGTLPCMAKLQNQAQIQCLATSSLGYTPGATADSMAIVANLKINTANIAMDLISSDVNGANSRNQITHTSTASQWQLNGANATNSTASDGSWHSATAVIQSGTNNGRLVIDNSLVAGSITHRTGAGNPTLFTCGTSATDAQIAEGWIADGAFTPTIESNLYTNMKAFYGTP